MARFQQGEIFHNRYRLEALVGMGGFAEVWKATDTIADTVHAIKIFAPDKGLSNNGIELFKKDYKLTASLRHTNLLTATHFDIYEESPYLVMPLCEKGSIDNKLREGLFSEDELAKVIEQVASGLAYMHSLDPPLIHRDIKTDNVLLADDGDYLITDFGISSPTKNSLRKATSTQQAISVSYAPPERFKSPPLSVPAGDIFSLGVMVYELCVGDVPWDGNGGLMLTQGASVPQLPPSYSRRLNVIIQACMSPHPDLRPAATELNKWAKAYRNDQIWPILPEKYAAALPFPDQEASKASNRKTQRMEDIEFPQQAGKTQAATSEQASKPKNQGEPKSDNKPSGGIGKVIGLAVVALIAVAGLFASDFFSENTDNNGSKTSALDMLNDSNLAENTKVNEEESKLSEDSAAILDEERGSDSEPAAAESTTTSDAPPATPKPKKTPKAAPEKAEQVQRKSTATNYSPAGSLSGALNKLGEQGISYQEKLAIKDELIRYFNSKRSVVITQVGGLVSNAEEAHEFAARIITLPNPQIKIISTEKEDGKVSKLVIEEID